MKEPRFIDLPRHKRRDSVIYVKNLIRRQTGVPSTKFWTHTQWDEDPVSWGGCLHLAFLGSNPWTYWWSCFFTKDTALRFIVDDMVSREFNLQISKADKKLYDEASTDWFEWLATPIENRVQDKADDMPFRSLGGLSVKEFKQQALQRLEKKPPEIYEEFWVRKEYRSGIGLFAIVDAEVLDIPTIENTIERFLAQGEQSSFPNGRLTSQFIV